MKNLQKQAGVVATILMGLLPAAFLIRAAVIGSFTRYIADDYCSAYWAKHFGLFRSVWHWYITWSGRFSAYASDWLVGLLGGRNIGIVPPVMLVIWLAATAIAIRLLLRRQDERGRWLESISLSAVFLFAVLITMPSIQTSFYWWNGMRSYTLPLMLLTVFIAAYEGWRRHLGSARAKILAVLGSFIYLFANGGLSDTFAVAQLGVLAALLLWSLYRRVWRAAELAPLASGMAGTVLALLVIAAAPGNAAREASFPAHPGIPALLGIAWQGYRDLWISFFEAPAKVLALLGAVSASTWAGASRPHAERRAWLGLLTLAAGLLIAFGALLPASWGLSEPPPARTLSVPVFVLVASVCCAAYMEGSELGPRLRLLQLEWGLAVVAIAALSLSAGMAIQGSSVQQQEAAQYAARWDTGEAQILQARAAGAKTVTVVAWPNWAGLDVLSDNPKNWLNQCTGGYYGVRIVGRRP